MSIVHIRRRVGKYFSTKRNRVFIPVLLIPYFLYLAYIISANRGAIDYETFMAIGQRFLHGQPVWIESSYYPIPYVIIFAFFSLLPRGVSMLIWHAGPVLIALAITNWSPWILLFGPLYGNMVGGQSAIFAMLGLWGYRKHINTDDWRAGFWLGILLLKPHLGIFPILWACLHWFGYVRRERRIPRQAIGFVATGIGLFLPGFLIMPDWVVQWQQRLHQYNPIIIRTEAGFIPRTLLFFTDRGSPSFWIPLLITAGLLLIIIWAIQRTWLTFDVYILWSTVISPLVHDYDVIQLIPLLDTPRKQLIAAVLSIPLWFVILLAYGNDQAWYVVTLIPLGLLLFNLFVQKQEPNQAKFFDANFLSLHSVTQRSHPESAR
jgi:hypothetical protein